MFPGPFISLRVTLLAPVLALVLASAQDGGARPLATWDPSGVAAFNDAALGEGVLEVGERCSYLLLEASRVLLVWPEPSRWNAETQTLRFTDVLGEELALKNGARIRPGGARATESTLYTRPPDTLCVADEVFVVATVVLAE